MILTETSETTLFRHLGLLEAAPRPGSDRRSRQPGGIPAAASKIKKHAFASPKLRTFILRSSGPQVLSPRLTTVWRSLDLQVFQDDNKSNVA